MDFMFPDDNTFYFDEFQIYGGAELAISGGTTEYKFDFLFFIGDRTGTVHVAPYQVKSDQILVWKYFIFI